MNIFEEEILRLIDARTWVSVLDVAALFYPNVKYARRVMSALEKRGLIQQVRVPTAANQGPGLSFYALANNGISQLDLAKGRQAPRQPTATSLRHYFGINFVLTGFTVLQKKYPSLKAVVKGDKEIRQAGYLSYVGRAQKPPFVCIPDFAIAVQLAELPLLVIGEVDAVTETISSESGSLSIAKKFSFFTSELGEKAYTFFRELFGKTFECGTYLHLTFGGQTRVERTLAAHREINEDHFTFFVGSADDLLPKEWKDRVTSDLYKPLLERLWHSPKSNERLAFYDERT